MEGSNPSAPNGLTEVSSRRIRGLAGVTSGPGAVAVSKLRADDVPEVSVSAGS
ncbi:MAG: hypothetical protein KDA27_15620 [Candidatus Eisenbacteria bacterium]|uniref:Uncharacterized protein n=1 Tax=Eiseniibacteriota bacterium TaxID=2212470 RepID=A0A956SFB1_UNCEI|nr:hypothetical protein [Candidatus Eisenbacteria bacterium]